MANKHWEQDKEATVYIGNLDERVSDGIVWELMLQAGRIVNVHLPKDRVTQTHQGFGFVQFVSEEDAEYAARIMNQVRLYGKPIRVNKASADKQKTVEIGAELFIGNLDPMVDEKTLYDTFSTFGMLIAAPKIARDDNGLSRGFGFVSFDNFDSSDKALESMNNQYLMNKEITISYAYKKDGKGERHGDQAERLLASSARKNNIQIQMYTLPPALVAPPTAPPTQAPTPDFTQTTPVAPPPQAFAPIQAAYNPPPAPSPQFQPPPQFAGGYGAPPPAQNFQQSRPVAPAPVAGLPARPPPPSGFNAPYGAVPPPAGFGGQGFPPPGFNNAAMGRGGAPGFPPPMGAVPPSMGFPVPGQPPYGAVPPPPVGFGQQPQGQYRR